MRKLGAKKVAWSIGAIAILGALTATGCSSDKPTELVPGVLTQLQVPRDLKGILVSVTANGRPVFCQTYQVEEGGIVNLPRTLGVVSGASAETAVDITIRGYDQTGTTGSDFASGCLASLGAGKTGGPRILRRSIQTFVNQHTLFVPMPLSYSCFDQDCAALDATDGHTHACRGGQCVDISATSPRAAASKLVDFSPSLVDGSDVCFSPSICFSDERPAVLASPGQTAAAPDGSAGAVDAAASEDCTYTFPPPPYPPPAGGGINVKVFYEELDWPPNAAVSALPPTLFRAGEVEILSADPDEGFTVLPDGKSFKLAPGLCALVNAARVPPAPPADGSTLTFHTISGVHVASACDPKAVLLPICAGERTYAGALGDGGAIENLADGGTTVDGVCNVARALVPRPSAIYMLMDDSAAMHAAFGPQGYATAMGLSLTDPVFKRTYAAFKFLPHIDAECTTSTTTLTSPAVDFGLAGVVQPEIAAKLRSWVAGGDTATAPRALDLQAAMRLTQGAYAAVTAFSKTRDEAPDIAGAMLFVNRVPDPTPASGNDCPVTFAPPTTANEAELLAIESKARDAYDAKPSLRTFFVVMNNDANDPAPLAFYTQVARDLPYAVTTLDATSPDAQVVLGSFASVVAQLGTCLYETPSGLTGNSHVQLGYGPGNTAIAADPSCTEATQSTANGWNVDGAGRLRICGAACDALRTTIRLLEAQAFVGGQPAPDVPVTATFPCSGVGSGQTDGSTTPSTLDSSASVTSDAAFASEAASPALDDAASEANGD